MRYDFFRFQMTWVASVRSVSRAVVSRYRRALLAILLLIAAAPVHPQGDPQDLERARARIDELGFGPEQAEEYLELLRRRPELLDPMPDQPIELPVERRPACNNGGFEQGTFNGWVGRQASNNLGSITGLVSVPLPSAQHTLMPDPIWAPGGYDPNLGGTALQVVPANGGSFATKLGDNAGGARVAILRKTFFVSSDLEDLYFRYALVLQDPGSTHTSAEKPFFRVRVLDANENELANAGGFTRVASAADPFFTDLGSKQIVYRRWSCARLALHEYVGQIVTVELMVADCALGRHFGYAYVDGLCETEFNQPLFTIPAVLCGDGPVTADGTATTGEIDHFWSVEVSDASGGRPDPASEVSEWFTGQAGVFDLKAWYEGKGRKFECGEYYRVKLAINTECSDWSETVKLIQIRCPDVDAGPDRAVCCCPPAHLQLGGSSEPGVQYLWSPAVGLSDPRISAPILDMSTFSDPNVPFPTIYQVTATDGAGCSATDTVEIRTVCGCRPAPRVTVEREALCSSRQLLTADCECGNATPEYLWTPTGATGPSVAVSVNEPTEYRVTCRNECGATVSAPVTVAPPPIVGGDIPRLECPNIFTPNGDGSNDTWVARDPSVPDGATPAYNATEYELVVQNRWGRVVARLSGATATGFTNLAIPAWDGVATEDVLYNWFQRVILGRRNSYRGQPVSEGVYYYFFRLRNCTHGWTDACVGFTHVVR